MAEGITLGIVLNKYFPYANFAYNIWVENERLLASARVALGDESFTAAWEAGWQMAYAGNAVDDVVAVFNHLEEARVAHNEAKTSRIVRKNA